MGGTLDDGFVVQPKYIGQRRLVEIAIATLTTDRALLLLGVPGTAKSWLSEHLSAAIAGDQEFILGMDNDDMAKIKEGGKKVDEAMLNIAKAQAALGSHLR